MDIPKILGILHERVGSPLSDEKLKSVTVTNLKTGLGSLDGEEDGEVDGISTWISPTTPPSNMATGNFTYRTSFDLSSLDPSSVSIVGRWESDNRLQSIILNAGTANEKIITQNSLGVLFSTIDNQNSWLTSPLSKEFNFAAFIGFYASGINTLDFVVNNSVANTPSGLRVQFTTQTAIPEPTTLVLLGIVAVAFSATRRTKA